MFLENQLNFCLSFTYSSSVFQSLFRGTTLDIPSQLLQQDHVIRQDLEIQGKFESEGALKDCIPKNRTFSKLSTLVRGGLIYNFNITINGDSNIYYVRIIINYN